jgi:LysM repeat protein
VPALLAVVATAAAPGIVHIRVRPGDTLWGIAQSHHTTVSTLRRLNHIAPTSDLIIAGQLLAVPGNGAVNAHAGRAKTGMVTTHYVVRSGDTVSAIARRYGTTTAAIIRRNHLSSSGLIEIGQRLTIAVHRRTTASTRIRYTAVHGPLPSRSEAAALVASAARRYGVDPALAMGLSYMESGFNQRAYSATGAIGIMQVMPGTGRWLADDVLHRSLDLRNARDNITAGVYLLRLLTSVAPTRIAVAGYYQGLASVRAHGMLPETKNYVANVLALRHRFGG